MIASNLIGWLVDTLLTTGALIAVVLLLRRPVSRLFGPGVAYALWALPLIRMALPPLVLPATLRPVAHAAGEHGAVVLAQAAPIVAAQEATVTVSSPLALLALWLSGAVLFLAIRARSYVALRRSLLAEARPMGEIGDIRIVESPAVESPVAFGVRDRVVALPLHFLFRTDPAARELAVAHEVEHHAARDLAVNIAFQPLLALHWFNPLGWMAWRAMRQDQEAACDARVLAGRGREDRHRYGQLIASLAAGPRLSLAASMAGPVLGRKAIVHRLRRIAADEPSTGLKAAGLALLALAVLALPLTAQISYASDEADEAASKGTHSVRQVLHHTVVRQEDRDYAPSAAALHEQVVHRGERTYVFRTEKPLSDGEVEARIAKADTDLPALPPVPEPADVAEPAEPAEPAQPAAPALPGKLQASADVDCDAAGDRIVDANGRENPAALAELHACIRGQVAAALREAGVARRKAGDYQAVAREAIRQARAEIMQERALTKQIHATVIGALDNALARMDSHS